MNKYLVIALLLFSSCADKPETGNNEDQKASPPDKVEQTTTDTPASKAYSNERFKDVRVNKLSDSSFRITGRAQVFEASFSWIIEDGHEELKQGHEMTDAGAPEFGNFNFTIRVQKKRPNSTLHLILFESSPKDGSRQYELPIPLVTD